MKNSFIAVDFETANSSRASACQIGLVKYVDGEIVDTFESLIKPHPTMSQFDGYNILVHGINAADVKNAPEFDQLWSQLSEFIDTEFLVAHNAGFDMSVFRGLFDLYGLTYPELQYLCTMMLSRNLVKPAELNLKYVAKTMGVDLTRHHNALDDAMAAGGITQALISQFEVGDLLELSALAKIRPGKFSSTGWRGSATRSSYNGKDETLAAMRERLSSDIDPSGPLAGSVFVLTGAIPGMSRNEAHERIVLAGGSWATSVTKKVTFLVEGDANSAMFREGETMSSKSRAVYDLREKGIEVSILDAHGFLSLLSP
jgi:DNA polymerase III epsilon subunit-like protein